VKTIIRAGRGDMDWIELALVVGFMFAVDF
jgi:hypothetical protein